MPLPTDWKPSDLIASPANIDIILTDIVLPGGLDGVALLKEAMRARPRMGVLCMSGYDPTQKHRKWLKIQNINLSGEAVFQRPAGAGARRRAGALSLAGRRLDMQPPRTARSRFMRRLSGLRRQSVPRFQRRNRSQCADC